MSGPNGMGLDENRTLAATSDRRCPVFRLAPPARGTAGHSLALCRAGRQHRRRRGSRRHWRTLGGRSCRTSLGDGVAAIEELAEAEVELVGRISSIRRQFLDDLRSNGLEQRVAEISRPGNRCRGADSIPGATCSVTAQRLPRSPVINRSPRSTRLDVLVIRFAGPARCGHTCMPASRAPMPLL